MLVEVSALLYERIWSWLIIFHGKFGMLDVCGCDHTKPLSGLSEPGAGDSNTPSCSSCLKVGIECVRELNIRFKHGTEHAEDLVFPEAQIWLEPTSRLQYVDETAQISQIYHGEEGLLDPERSRMTGVTFLFRDADSPARANLMSTISLRNPSNPERRNTTRLFGSVASTRSDAAVFTRHEATLIKNFIDNMAPWADITDLGRHFEIEVPCRALYHPVLRYAIFAFSSRHLHRHLAGPNTEALEFYNQCLGLLIQLVAEQKDQVTEEVLAAIAILRQYEEMDVNTMSIADFNGGLGEAAAWLCLREDICVSLAKQRPLKTDLETFLLSDVFRRTDDAAYASRMIFLVAKALRCAFANSSSGPALSLDHVHREVDDWFRLRPATFMPIKETPRDEREGLRLPGIWTLTPFHAIGLQHYHIAKIICAASPPAPASSMSEGFRHERNEQVR
ncbi:Uncharacterized protein TPAR_08690 [Tolypocladium paradoxum]|uniref:Zn(2)-C6 fungal-type domain-containing protein n=1 Tax=Tolypocladium paradoxum TaxID=94208 RepID=A0A2S4KLN6_9HYPO|nr:Uncharacterized protein TPAR_08690 [Tolypocladium paradoxum]